MNCDQAKEVGPAIMDKMVGQEIKSSNQVITMAKEKVKRQDRKLQVVDPQDLFNLG